MKTPSKIVIVLLPPVFAACDSIKIRDFPPCSTVPEEQRRFGEGGQLCVCDAAATTDPNDACCVGNVCQDKPDIPEGCAVRPGPGGFPFVGLFAVSNATGFGLPKACEPLRVDWTYTNPFSSPVPASSTRLMPLRPVLRVSQDPNELMTPPFMTLEFEESSRQTKRSAAHFGLSS